ncbi:MAG: trigger factor [Acidimicrobiia bacterium]
MPTTVTEAGPFERVVNLHITDDEIDAGKPAAARRLSAEMKLKGFRPGKAPTPVVEAAVGRDRLRQETIDDLINPTLNRILSEEDLRPAVSPQLEAMDDVDGGVDVSVRVTIWPEIETPHYKDRNVEVDSPEVTDDDMENQIKRMLEQFAVVEEVERPAEVGDFVSIDISATQEGELIEEANASDLLYEVGSAMFIEGIDEQVTGKSAGDEVTFDGKLPEGFGDLAGAEVSFKIVVQEVKERILPDLTDEWVEENTEFKTVEELTNELRERLADAKLQAVHRQFGELAMKTLRDQLDVELPEALVRAEMDNHLHRFVHRLEENELTLDDYFEAAGIERNVFVDDLREQATLSLQNQLILEAVAQAEGIEITEEDMAIALQGLAARAENPSAFIQAFAQSGQELALASDILRNRAMDAILSGATPVDENGSPVDLELRPNEVEAEIVEAEPVEGEVVAEVAEEEE